VALEENDRLQARNLKPLPTLLIPTDENVIHANKVITRFLKLRPIFIGGIRRQRFLFRAANPANWILSPHSTFRAGVRGCFDLLSLGEKVPFVHGN